MALGTSIFRSGSKAGDDVVQTTGWPGQMSRSERAARGALSTVVSRTNSATARVYNVLPQSISQHLTRSVPIALPVLGGLSVGNFLVLSYLAYRWVAA